MRLGFQKGGVVLSGVEGEIRGLQELFRGWTWVRNGEFGEGSRVVLWWDREFVVYEVCR